ncbi:MULTISPECIES: lipid A biosynthesis (KDO)2-(lauroyl)-lipid IVA acyltransferase [Aeromonas]|uniref:lipid A biosynthesis (KDO)2-(lauroyl)-lipid IVA acyltransferase n=1 Tax=Aeromonas TaxID=642 RepID=UPI00191F012B|nr:lipid A biosynthesis (KDO)2-(lauroyl)-lipid IVA acyltransferase [Aeromonas caviae]MBL0436326.1 lipid A biosynthesis (KDO)2-(lauroyl)-lipid IVA acyltransferase [Aeromonas caviae]MCX4035350.1 lipid A biosynthesis (KDO)2-(lauroyl)-lipid IVA acyltransferase [Aeromonas caviae]MDX7643209.1 lipid A biosynthesis (KDO)2-(lauroyl)-lipid IVA acyltransferase [Aeromonas caviae]
MSSSDPVFDARFQPRLLHPRYWLSWLALGAIGVLAFVPPRWRDRLADALTPLVCAISKKQIYIARTNLAICFKEKSEAEREAILMTSIRVGLKSLLGFGEFTWRSPAHVMGRIQVSGWEHIEAEQATGRPVILVVPHSWPIDAAGYYFAQRGLPMCTMMKSARNPVFDWHINGARARHGCRVYERSAGIKPVIKAVKSGLSFFYLPDQDHGREASLFAPFFNHPKATLPALPRLVKLTGARALPVLACYDEQAHGYRLEVEAPYADYPSGDLMADTCRMNDSVERQLCRHPGQYMWFLKIFDTREDQVGPDGLYEEGIRRIRRGLAPHP